MNEGHRSKHIRKGCYIYKEHWESLFGQSECKCLSSFQPHVVISSSWAAMS